MKKVTEFIKPLLLLIFGSLALLFYMNYLQLQDEYLVKANIVSYAKADIDEENVKIHYSINDGEYVEGIMKRYKDTTNFTFYFSDLKEGDDIKYYIDAYDEQNNYNVDPTCGKLDPHHFTVAK